MTKQVFLGCISCFLVIMVAILPSAIKIHHALAQHKEIHCDDTTNTHIHEIEFDCDFQKYHIAPSYLAKTTSVTPVKDLILKQKNFGFYFEISEYQKLHFSLRGPPTVL